MNKINEQGIFKGIFAPFFLIPPKTPSFAILDKPPKKPPKLFCKGFVICFCGCGFFVGRGEIKLKYLIIWIRRILNSGKLVFLGGGGAGDQEEMKIAVSSYAYTLLW